VVGRSTGFPFGDYDYTGTYSSTLGPRILGVPLVIPLAWTWMAWPAWLAAGRLVQRPAGRLVQRPAPRIAVAGPRIAVAGIGLAAWDLFLDPQMVSEGYWQWAAPAATLPGVPDIPVTNHLGWLATAVALMALLGWAAGPDPVPPPVDAPMYAVYLWTYTSSILAHAVFLGLPVSAAWGAAGMGLVAVPLAVRLWPA
jgi:putative membrane protein